MKYQEGHFLQIPRDVFKADAFTSLSIGAQAMYFWLKELEHRYISNGAKENRFFHTDMELATLMGISTRSIERYRKELINAGIIKFSKVHFRFDNGKLSEKRVACYELINGY